MPLELTLVNPPDHRRSSPLGTALDMDTQNAKDILWGLYQDHAAQIRHYETQRSTVTNLLLVTAAALLTVVISDKAITRTDVPLTVLVFLIGLFGAAFTVKYHERATFHYQLLEKYRETLDEQVFNSMLINEVRKEVKQQHRLRFPRLYGGKLSGWKVHRLWMLFHLLISLSGLVLTFLAALSPQASTPTS